MTTTESSLSTEQSRDTFRGTSSMDFPSMDLDENLIVRTVDTGVGENRGFDAFFSITTTQATLVTVSVLEEDTVIAEREREVPSATTRSDWRIPLVDDSDHYTFSRNSA
ncbi:MAG: hypothetical protein GWN18_16735, partial [Thermoplasmata archaeon]|nr:hypothetical protein [Thermoplasmata archaeon]NIS21597.1 hypothetical protein [Thermoplasmata archaeon]NIT79182.1 hypothetical protein [Thermoplasmata archaeon]NIU50636.1 hypothetical protein [Thermoplasmata archaeon]NIV80359.1 hypothetical protein [Thermoplasmata archaeon]